MKYLYKNAHSILCYTPFLTPVELHLHYPFLLRRMPPLPIADNAVPVDEHLSLSQFTRDAQAKYLASRDGDVDAMKDFVHFTLCGLRRHPNGQYTRVFINSLLNAASVLDDDLIVRRDYDSCFGLSYDLPFAAPMSIFTLFPFRDTLKKTVHLDGWIFDQYV